MVIRECFEAGGPISQPPDPPQAGCHRGHPAPARRGTLGRPPVSLPGFCHAKGLLNRRTDLARGDSIPRAMTSQDSLLPKRDEPTHFGRIMFGKCHCPRTINARLRSGFLAVAGCTSYAQWHFKVHILSKRGEPSRFDRIIYGICHCACAAYCAWRSGIWVNRRTMRSQNACERVQGSPAGVRGVPASSYSKSPSPR
jgi:hypothetical protein